MVAPTSLLEAVKVPLFLQTSFKATEVLSLLPYLQGISEKILRTSNQFSINVAHNPVMTVGSIKNKPKDKFSKDLSIGVIYKINCKDCDEVYIGQT